MTEIQETTVWPDLHGVAGPRGLLSRPRWPQASRIKLLSMEVILLISLACLQEDGVLLAVTFLAGVTLLLGAAIAIRALLPLFRRYRLFPS